MIEIAPMGIREMTDVSVAPMSHLNAIPNYARFGMRGRLGVRVMLPVEMEQCHVIEIAPMGAWDSLDATEIRTRPNLATPVLAVSKIIIYNLFLIINH